MLHIYLVSLLCAQATTYRWRFVSQDERGAHPIAGAVVRTTAGDGVWQRTKTDRDGRVVVTLPRNGSAMVEAPGLRPAVITLVSSDTAAAPTEAEFTLRRVITGTVREAQGRAVADARVEVDSGAASSTIVRTALVTTRTDATGRFTVAPRVIYIAAGLTSVDDPITIVASTADGQELGVFAPPTRLGVGAATAITVSVAPPRTLEGSVTVPAGVVPDQYTVSVYPPTDTSAEPRPFTNGAMQPVDSTRWTATFTLPVNARYRVYAMVGPFGQTAPFDVPAGTEAVKVPELSIGFAPLWAQRGPVAPEVAATTLGGESVHLRDYRGKAVVLAFVRSADARSRVARYADSTVVLVAGEDAFAAYGIVTALLPITVVIDSSGRLAGGVVGDHVTMVDALIRRAR